LLVPLQVRDIIYVAGQIGLVPGTMKLVEGGARMECKLALRHLNRIMKATDYKVELRDVVQVSLVFRWVNVDLHRAWYNFKIINYVDFYLSLGYMLCHGPQLHC